MKPVIKWVGGKQSNLQYIRDRLPKAFNNYYEPFLGGGAVLLDLNPKTAVVNDINPELINMYIQLKNNPYDLIGALSFLDAAHNCAADPSKYYYSTRDKFNSDLGSNTAVQAARFIYLNKHCFNGIYRVNKKGEFNVPYNFKNTGKSFDPDHLKEVSNLLSKVTILNSDFEVAVKDAREGDLVFFDSPYDLITDTSFTDYTKEGFGYSDHARLARLFKELDSRGCFCILTNHDTPLIRELYKDYKIEVVDVRRSVNRNGSDRKGKEVIITNFRVEENNI